MTEPEPAGHSGIAAGPADASGLVSDVTGFVFHRPEISTHVAVESDSWREDYTLRIAQRTGVDVSVYSILNIHRIGINAPVEIVFEEVERCQRDVVRRVALEPLRVDTARHREISVP